MFKLNTVLLLLGFDLGAFGSLRNKHRAKGESPIGQVVNRVDIHKDIIQINHPNEGYGSE